MRKTIISITAFTLITSNAISQVLLKGIVEHFTNTNCGACASRNPGLLTNVNNFPNVNYISVHPSAPYASCLLSQQNTADNNARTNFYGIFGGTPRIVISGTVIGGGVNYSSASLLNGLGALTTDYSIRIETNKNTDSITNKVIIKKQSSVDAYTSASLFLGAVEDTVTYTGGNGEAKHYNVLRKTLHAAQAVTLPVNVGDSIIINANTLLKNSIWDWNRMRIAAVLMDNNKKLIQSEIQNTATVVVTPTSIKTVDINTLLSVYPNPSSGTLNIQSLTQNPIKVQLTSIIGNIIPLTIEANSTQSLQDLAKGLYILSANNNSSIKILVQ